MTCSRTVSENIKMDESLSPLKIVQQSSDLESKLDELRKFKSARVQDIEERFFHHEQDLPSTMNKLTDLADSVLMAAAELAKNELRFNFGLPQFKDNDGQFLPSDFAIIGMGKLGGHELHFGSDLDLIFIFSRHGQTQVGRPLTNQEYFAKLAQRIISYLGLYTRFGFLYKVDTELRPSGKAGALVSEIHSWTTYYHEHALLWERQALLKARLIFSTGKFSQEFKGLFRRLIFLKPFPENMAEEINYLRMRIERELAKESPKHWHYKKGHGGLVDIEFTVQFLQLKLGKIFDQLLSPNTLEALQQLRERRILKPNEAEVLEKAYLFYRRLEIILELKFNLKEGYLDLDYERMPEVAKEMSLSSASEFIQAFGDFRDKVREIYLHTLQIRGK